jgi:hypothetical protein
MSFSSQWEKAVVKTLVRLQANPSTRGTRKGYIIASHRPVIEMPRMKHLEIAEYH